MRATAVNDTVTALREFDRNPAWAGRGLRDALRQDGRYFLRVIAQASERDVSERGLRYAMILLLHNDLLIPSIVNPSATTIEEALRLTRNMLKVNFNFLNELLRVFPTRSELVKETECVLRVLDIVDNCVEHVGNWRCIVRIHQAGDARIKMKCARLIAQYRFENPAGLERFCNADPRIRANIIEILWGVEKPGASMVLEAAMQDTNSRVAGNAWLSQYTAGMARSLRGISALLESPEPGKRKTGIWVVGQSRDGRFSNHILKMSLCDIPEIREAAKGVLSTLDPIPDPDWDVVTPQPDRMDVSFVSAPVSVFASQEEAEGFELWLSVKCAAGKALPGIRPVDFFVETADGFIMDYSIEEVTCAEAALGIVYPAGSEALVRAFRESIRTKAPEHRWAFNSYERGCATDGDGNRPRFEANGGTLGAILDSGPPSSADTGIAVTNILTALNGEPNVRERHLILILDGSEPERGSESEVIESLCRGNNVRLHCWRFHERHDKPEEAGSDLPDQYPAPDSGVNRGARRFWEIDETVSASTPQSTPVEELSEGMDGIEPLEDAPGLPGIVRDEVQSALIWPAFVASMSHRYILRAQQQPTGVSIRRIEAKSIRFPGRTQLLPAIPE